MPKAKNKSNGTEVNFTEQPNETVVYSENAKHQAVITKEEFNKQFDVVGEAPVEQPAQ